MASVTYSAACGDSPPDADPELVGRDGAHGGDGGAPDAQATPPTPPNQVGCAEGAKLVYVLDLNNALHAFIPDTLTFKDVGTLSCPDVGIDVTGNPARPHSMTIDRDGVAWVIFSSGKLFKVNTANASCSATAFDPAKNGVERMTISFSTDSVGAKTETLYGNNVVADFDAGVLNSAGLSKLDTTTFSLAPVGNYTDGLAGLPTELTVSGDGKLFGFFTTKPATLAEIDTATGATPSAGQKVLLGVNTSNWYAFAFWGGDFWFFTSTYNSPTSTDTSDVTRYKKSTDGSITRVKTAIGFNIVGAGVSTCAPTK